MTGNRYNDTICVNGKDCERERQREMQKILDRISEKMMAAFEAAGYDRSLGRVTLSNRPDLCEFQCNGAMAGAKQYHKAPLMIAQDVAAQLADSELFSSVDAVAPGFLNLKIKEKFLKEYLNEMEQAEKFGLNTAGLMWQSLFMWDIYVPRSLGRVSSASAVMQGTTLSEISIWETGDFRWVLSSQSCRSVNRN